MAEVQVPPADAYNQELVRNVHPADWRNPMPREPYDLLVIGAGTAGLITSLLASSLGARVGLVERHLLGGDCLNVGCVPSKALIAAARQVHTARRASRLGLRVADSPPNFGAVMARLRAIRARISADDAARRYRDEFGVDVHLGHARFTGAEQVEVDGTALRAHQVVVASGARAAAPPIPGLAEAGYLDNETVFQLTERPPRLAVIGAGPIGCELSQAFQRLGSQVHLLEAAPQILVREDADAAQLVAQSLLEDGVELVLGCRIDEVERQGSTRILQLVSADGSPRALEVDQVLVGVGRAPNVEELGLERVGVEVDPRRGVRVNDFLRTRNRRIWAAGDVCMDWKFTHAADAAAKIVVQNALFALGPLGRRRLSKLRVPWCTYTDPEIAHVGLYPWQAAERGMDLATFVVPVARANRAVTDGEERGFVKVHVRKGTDRILGATVVASHAGELITQLTLAMERGVGLGAFSRIIYPYPTQGEAIQAAAGAYTRTRLTPLAARLLRGMIRLRRRS